MEQKPTIGRAVHYVEGTQHLAATVAYVHSETCINVGGFDVNGQPFAKTSVLYHAEGASGSWHWPEREG